jgi:hypothetical protein
MILVGYSRLDKKPIYKSTNPELPNDCVRLVSLGKVMPVNGYFYYKCNYKLK